MPISKILAKNKIDNPEIFLKKLKKKILNPRLRSVSSLQKTFSSLFKQAKSQNRPYHENMLKYCFSSSIGSELKSIKEIYLYRIQNALKSLNLTNSLIQELTLKKIPKNGNVFVHDNSKVLLDILAVASKNKKFNILILHSNKILISALKKARIKFQCFEDKAIRIAVKQADIVFMSCYAITPAKIIHSIGSELAAELAHKRNIPVYICTPAQAFTNNYNIPHHKITKSGKTYYHDYNYEQIAPELITGIISEIGIYDHNTFIRNLKDEMPWIFTSFS